jgi:hypothetical protein
MPARTILPLREKRFFPSMEKRQLKKIDNYLIIFFFFFQFQTVIIVRSNFKSFKCEKAPALGEGSAVRFQFLFPKAAGNVFSLRKGSAVTPPYLLDQFWQVCLK